MIEGPKKDIRIPFLVALTIAWVLIIFLNYAGEIRLRKTAAPENLVYREISMDIKVSDQFLNVLLMPGAESIAVKKKILAGVSFYYERAAKELKDSGIYYCKLGIINAGEDIKKAGENFEAGRKNGEEALVGLLEDIYFRDGSKINKLSAAEIAQADKIMREKLSGWFLYSSLEALYSRISSTQASEIRIQASEFGRKKMPAFFLLIFLLFGLPAAGFIGIPLYIFVFRKKELFGGEIFPVKWTVIDAWSVFIILEMIRIIFWLLLISLKITGLSMVTGLIINFAMSLFIMFLIYDVIRKLGSAFADMGLKTADFIKKASYGIFAFFACFLPIKIADLVTQYFYKGPHVSSNPVMDIVEKSGGVFNLLMIFLFVSVIAPVFEEILFRGFLYGAFRNKLGPLKANLFVSFIFALVHQDIATFLSIFTLGMILTYTFEKTRSLIPSIILHGFFNLHTFVIVRLLVST